MDYKVVKKRKHGLCKMVWRRQVVKQVDEIGLKKKDAIDRSTWRDAVNKLLKIMR